MTISPHPLTRIYSLCWPTMVLAFATSTSVVGKSLRKRRKRRPIKHPYLWQWHLNNPEPGASAATTSFAPLECRACGLQRGGVASSDRENAPRWPAPAQHFVTNHIVDDAANLLATVRCHGGKGKHAASWRASQSVSLGLDSALPSSRRHLSRSNPALGCLLARDVEIGHTLVDQGPGVGTRALHSCQKCLTLP